jgi:hypothetical protein
VAQGAQAVTVTDTRREQLRTWGRAGGIKRAQAFTAASQSAARANVKPENLLANGRKGNATCQRRYGAHYAARRLATWRSARPTGLERTVAGWLDAAWVSFSTEVELVAGLAYGDIVVRAADGRRLDIECNGQHWHQANDHAGQDRVTKDLARDALVRAAGYAVLRLAQADIESGAAKAILSKEIGVRL